MIIKKVYFFKSLFLSLPISRKAIPELVTEEAEFCGLSRLPDDQLEGQSSTMVVAVIHLCIGQCHNYSFPPEKTVLFSDSFLDNSRKHQSIHKFISFDSKILYIL